MVRGEGRYMCGCACMYACMRLDMCVSVYIFTQICAICYVIYLSLPGLHVGFVGYADDLREEGVIGRLA